MLPMRQRAQRLLRRQAVLEVARRFQAPAASTSAEFVRLLDLVRGERGSSTPGKLSLGSLLVSDADLVQLGAFLTKPGSDHIQTLDLRHNDLYKRQVGLASLVKTLIFLQVLSNQALLSWLICLPTTLIMSNPFKMAPIQKNQSHRYLA